MRKLLLSMMAGSLLVHPANAQVPGGVFICANCATEPTQLRIQLMHDLEYAKQLLQYAIQVQQLADAIKNTKHGGAASLTAIAADLGMLAAVVQGGRALAYSLGNDDVLFRQTYPGYQPLGTVGPPVPLGSYANRYAIWAQTSLDTTQGILRGAGLQGKLLATEQGVLAILRGLTASNLLNRNDAINLTGQAAEQVAQMQKLRELQLEDMTSKAAYQGYQVQKDADMVATEQQFFGQTTINAGDSRVFPTTP